MTEKEKRRYLKSRRRQARRRGGLPADVRAWSEAVRVVDELPDDVPGEDAIYMTSAGQVSYRGKYADEAMRGVIGRIQ